MTFWNKPRTKHKAGDIVRLCYNTCNYYDGWICGRVVHVDRLVTIDIGDGGLVEIARGAIILTRYGFCQDVIGMTDYKTIDDYRRRHVW